jgi:hypothetical protein
MKLKNNLIDFYSISATISRFVDSSDIDWNSIGQTN